MTGFVVQGHIYSMSLWMWVKRHAHLSVCAGAAVLVHWDLVGGARGRSEEGSALAAGRSL